MGVGRARWGGGNGEGEKAPRRGRWGRVNREGEKGRGRGGGDSEGDDWEGEMGIEGPKGREGKGGQAHRMLGGKRLQFFCDFVYPCNAGYPS